MSSPVLTTKLFIPVLPAKILIRPRLIERLNEGLSRKLTLVSAAAGFGKTTIISEWVKGTDLPVAWISLDEEHNDPVRFLLYLVSAVQTVAPETCGTLLASLSSPQPPPVETMVTMIINELAQLPLRFILVLDDYHVLDSPRIDKATAFLLEHLPPSLHLVIATREDPPLPLSRLRAKGQVTEIRAGDLKFNPEEAAELLNGMMGLNVGRKSIQALSSRTEGWIAGLQLASVSLQGAEDPKEFVRKFAGSNRYILDYLVEEVLEQQPGEIQEFLLQTSILKRFCGPLCDAVIQNPKINGRETLHYLERANLFIIPLDDKRQWYRYHHLFAEFLRQRLLYRADSYFIENSVDEKLLHIRSSRWYEEHDHELEAFLHAADAMDIDRAERLIEGKGMPLHLRGTVHPVLNWLETLSDDLIKTRPVLNVMHASALLFLGKTGGVEEKLRTAEGALQGKEDDEHTRDLIGHIAAVRASLALSRHDENNIFLQSRKALEYLHPDNLPVRTATTWLLGYAHHLEEDYETALQLYSQAVSVAERIGHFIVIISCYLGIGEIQEMKGRLHKARDIYLKIVKRAGTPPLPLIAEAYMGLARICYEWDQLEAAEEYARQGGELAQYLEHTDRQLACDVFSSRLMLAKNDAAGASALLRQAGATARERGFSAILPEIARAKVKVFLRRNYLSQAAAVIDELDHPFPLARSRICLARGDAAEALTLVQSSSAAPVPEYESKRDLQTALLRSCVLFASGKKKQAQEVFNQLLVHSEGEGFIRMFIDEGRPVDELLSTAIAQGIAPVYGQRVLKAFQEAYGQKTPQAGSGLVEHLSPREKEVLSLIAGGLSNNEISEKLFISLSTVKGHNRQIFEKLQVNRRTEAVAKARGLKLI